MYMITSPGWQFIPWTSDLSKLIYADDNSTISARWLAKVEFKDADGNALMSPYATNPASPVRVTIDLKYCRNPACRVYETLTLNTTDSGTGLVLNQSDSTMIPLGTRVRMHKRHIWLFDSIRVQGGTPVSCPDQGCEVVLHTCRTTVASCPGVP